jgi:C_GCAxxG_C_C family probable redox protein
MTKTEDAMALAKQGFGCAQVVFSTFAPDFGIDRDTALKLSQGFVGGMSQTDNICGAVSAAVMVIGLRYASPRADDVEAKGKTLAKVNEFQQEFKERHGAIDCTDLLGYNLSDPQQRDEGRKNIPMRCPPLIGDAINLIEKLI